MAKPKNISVETEVVPESPTAPTEETATSVSEEIEAKTPSLNQQIREQLQTIYANAAEGQIFSIQELTKQTGLPERAVAHAWHNLGYGFVKA
jgi:DNA-binding MurR/RpiR family transcriptional regulator